MSLHKKTQKLEQRVVNYTCDVLELQSQLKEGYLEQHLAKQIIRSSTSVALNFGEAQGAESRKDFIHKLKVVLKELRETFICLSIIERRQLIKKELLMRETLQESNELISIFVTSIKTARKNDEAIK